MLQTINEIFDWLYFGLISPLFHFLSRGLESVLLGPLDFFNIHPAVQVVLIAVLTAAISFAIRRLLRVDAKRLEFSKQFVAKREKQHDIDLISDWKSRDTLYRFTDRELDEDFNTHLASRYSQFVMTYLLPVLLALAWLNSVFTPEILAVRHGSSYLLPLSHTVSGIEGLPVTFVFLVGYGISIIAGFRIRALKTKKLPDGMIRQGK